MPYKGARKRNLSTLAKSAATLPLPSNILPMLRLALVAAAEEAAIATRQTKVVLHLMMKRQIPTKIRATTTVLTMMVIRIKCRVFGHKMVLCN